MKHFFLLLFGMTLGFLSAVTAQVTVTVTVQDGQATTTCSDFLTPPDPIWEVNVNQAGWVTYPAIGVCYTALPHEQYSEDYPCPSDVPPEVEICFRAMENDGALFEIGAGCAINAECIETICQNFALPAAGDSIDYTLSLPAGGSSEGFVDFTVRVGGSLAGANDLLCDAFDLGAIPLNDTIGNAQLGIYSNQCATNAGEPNPADVGHFTNDAGVWFTFTATGMEGQFWQIESLADPENSGDDMDVQLALYVSDNGACDGNLTFVAQAAPGNSLDSYLPFYCPDPNLRYYLLVDGGFATATSVQGTFSLQISSISETEAPDARCDAEDLGVVPAGGSVGTDGPRTNFCATSAGDPFSPNFVTQTSVWFRFEAPPSGHVIIEGLALDPEPLGVQLALYRSLNGSCSGFFYHVTSQFTTQDFSETMEVSCLYPGEPYWILVDGSGSRGRGIFSISVSDAGDITPVTSIDTTICSGETFTVGNSTYSMSGLYSDTLQVFAGCDSIVNTNLTVLPPIVVTIDTLQPAVGMGSPNGVAAVGVTGGTGVFTYQWCTGETGSSASSLVGGEDCCVTVTDNYGCEAVECFTVYFVEPVAPVFSNDSLDCFGDSNGAITFSVIEGQPPYTYSWQNADNSLNGSGAISAEGEEVTVADLPAGQYSFLVADAFTDATFTAEVWQPEELQLDLLGVQDASCFGFCDGEIAVAASGGTGSYSYAWSGGLPASDTPAGVCAGNYTVTVTDANSCEAVLDVEVFEPEEFIATGIALKAVSCFGGSDGSAEVSTNGNPIQYTWSTGATTVSITDLAAGFYDVTVTNEDGCEATASVQITQPAAPVGVIIEVAAPVSCFDTADGVLGAVPSGPGQSFTFTWSDGQQTQQASELGPGNYSVTIANENGCEAEASLALEAPPPIEAQVTGVDLTCLDASNGGSIVVESISGGVPGYEVSLDGVVFTGLRTFPGLFPDSYTVVVRDALGCEAVFPASVNGPPEVDVSLGDDFSIHLGDVFELEAQVNVDQAGYAWRSSIGDTLSPQGALLVHQPLSTAIYTVTVTDSVSFCTATDYVMVSVVTDRRVFIPNAFSPDGDGYNDTFTVFGGPDVEAVTDFRVFSRNGALLYQLDDLTANDTEAGWDGTFKGQTMSAAVYVYLAKVRFIDGKEEVYSGDVVLMR